MDLNRMESRRRVSRLAVVLVLAATPTAAVAWVGCSSSSSNGGGGGRANVDPGGTYGAEVAVTVIGRGRVITTVAGLNCPSGIRTRYTCRSRIG